MDLSGARSTAHRNVDFLAQFAQVPTLQLEVDDRWRTSVNRTDVPCVCPVPLLIHQPDQLIPTDKQERVSPAEAWVGLID